jgi:hypothetical protein
LSFAFINIFLAFFTSVTAMAHARKPIGTVDAGSMIRARGRRTFINIYIAMISTPSSIASARIRVDAIDAMAVATISVYTLVNVGLTVLARPPCITVAHVFVYTIHTAAVVGACLSSTFIYVGLTIGSRKASIAIASELVHTVHTVAVVGAHVARTVINVGMTN